MDSARQLPRGVDTLQGAGLAIEDSGIGIYRETAHGVVDRGPEANPVGGRASGGRGAGEEGAAEVQVPAAGEEAVQPPDRQAPQRGCRGRGALRRGGGGRRAQWSSVSPLRGPGRRQEAPKPAAEGNPDTHTPSLALEGPQDGGPRLAPGRVAAGPGMAAEDVLPIEVLEPDLPPRPLESPVGEPLDEGGHLLEEEDGGPDSRASMAAARPAKPPPTTRISAESSHSQFLSSHYGPSGKPGVSLLCLSKPPPAKG